MRHLFVLDPLELLLPEADTSIAFLREAQRRGHSSSACRVETLGLDVGGRPRATALELTVREGSDWHVAGHSSQVHLDDFDVVWMRKDPPFDLNYLFATHILSLIRPPTLVVNDPQALRDANEKIFALHFPEVCPETIVSRSIAELLEFRESLEGEMVVKPLDGAGGEGVFHITPDDRNAKAILEMSTRHGALYLMAQRFLPEVREGDKRIILVEGEPVGAVLRVPAAGEARANFHVGGRAERTELSARDREICGVVGPTLRERGILFAGIDVIGGWLTEVNVTSPTGIREIHRLDGTVIERLVLDAVEARHAEQAG
ncbi:MAG TPA: glutathione synthase [Thermoanaerobaculia bacterium]|nr:glutathione synthase [Thermoanaerobaculia bacterium]